MFLSLLYFGLHKIFHCISMTLNNNFSWYLIFSRMMWTWKQWNLLLGCIVHPAALQIGQCKAKCSGRKTKLLLFCSNYTTSHTYGYYIKKVIPNFARSTFKYIWCWNHHHLIPNLYWPQTLKFTVWTLQKIPQWLHSWILQIVFTQVQF